MASSMGPGKMVTDGLVLHLDAGNTKSYPGSGTVWTDLSSTAITGSLTNGPTFSSVNNGVIRFDGTNDFVDLGTTSTLNFTGPFSVSFWGNLNVIGSSQYFVNRWTYGAGNFRQWSLDNLKGGIYPGPIENIFQFRMSSNGLDAGSVFITSSVNVSYSNNWVNVCGIWDGSFIYLYINGTSANTRVSASSMVSTNGQKTFIGGGDTGTALPPTGSIAQVSIYNRALSANEVFQNYEATRERFNRPTIVTDDDARNFLNAAFISSETQQRAVNDLVVDMKNVGLWGKMKAIYPFVGGTAASHKWNLKDPRDVDAAFRLTFYGGWTHSSTGAKGNGSTSYADTSFLGSTSFINNNTHISYYSRTDSNGNYIDMGMYRPTTPSTAYDIHIRLLGNYYYDAYSISNRISGTSTTSLGYYFNVRTDATTHKVFRNGIQFASSSATSVTNTSNMTIPIYLNALNDNGSSNYRTDRECSFATIGDGLTDTDAANLYTIVQKYQTTLGRQV